MSLYLLKTREKGQTQIPLTYTNLEEYIVNFDGSNTEI